MKFKLSVIAIVLAVPATVTAQVGAGGQLGCLLEPSMQAEISSRAPGVVQTVMVERGERVAKGQALVLLEASVEETILELAKAKVDFADRKLARNRDLISTGLLSTHEQDEIVTERHLAVLEAREAEARLEQRTIRSPLDGIVVERKISPGEYVSADPVLKLVALDPLHAEVVMDAAEYGTIREGMKAKLVLDGPVKGRFPGRVQIVDKVLDAASGTFRVQVRVPNPGVRLPSGLKCKVQFEQRKRASKKSKP